MRTTSRTSGKMWNASPNIWIIGIPEEEDKKKGHEKILEEIIVENLPKMEKEINTQVQETQRVPNRINPKTHINQINKDQTQRTNIKSSKGKTTNNTQEDSHKDNSWSFNRNSSGQKGMAAVAAKSLQSCRTLCDPIDSSPPGSQVPGILQARTLECSSSSAWKWKVKVKSFSRVRLLVTPWTAAYQAPPSMGFSRQEYWSGVPLPTLEGNSRTYLKWWKKKTYSPDYCTRQGSHSNMKEKSKALQTSKSWENSAPPNQLSNTC